MLSWTVSISSSARKSIRRAPRHERERLRAELDRLAVDPLGGNTVRLHGLPNTARRRVGDWRVIFELDFDRAPSLRDPPRAPHDHHLPQVAAETAYEVRHPLSYLRLHLTAAQVPGVSS